MHLSESLPFLKGRWRLSMGLKPLHLPEWIEINSHFVEELQLKQQLLSDRPTEVFASLPGSEIAQREALQLLIGHLLNYFPHLYEQQGDRLLNRATGQIWHLSALAVQPLDLAGRLIQEDLCLLLPQAGNYVLSAASVCFPSRWKLQEKMGLPVSAIHQPVPHYTETLEHPVDSFFDRLQPDYPGYRWNWSLVDSGQLFLPEACPTSVANRITAANAGRQLWLRVERQTLRRLPVSQAVLFTIHTSVYQLEDIITPAIAHDLAVVIQQMPPTTQSYKSISLFRTALLNYLTAAQTNGEL
jgi:hypothetical protein